MSPGLTDLLLRAQSDERLVRLAVAGHERAFAVIIERYRAELIAFAAHQTRDPGAAEDIVQQALLSALSALRAGAEVHHLRGWLFQITRHAAWRVRAQPHQPLEGAEPPTEALEEVVERRADVRTALTALSALPERQRLALIGMTFGGVSRAELAATMGLSEGAIRQLVHRARTTVRTSVTALTPWWLVRGVGARSGPSGSGETLVAGGGALSGAVAKVGAVVASGVLAGAVAVLPAPRGPRSGSGAQGRPAAAVSGVPGPGATGATGGRPLLIAARSVGGPGTAGGISLRPATGASRPQPGSAPDGGRLARARPMSASIPAAASISPATAALAPTRSDGHSSGNGAGASSGHGDSSSGGDGATAANSPSSSGGSKPGSDGATSGRDPGSGPGDGSGSGTGSGSSAGPPPAGVGMSGSRAGDAGAPGSDSTGSASGSGTGDTSGRGSSGGPDSSTASTAVASSGERR